MYLEPIFSAPDIQKQLPAECKAFDHVHRHLKEVMRRTKDRPNALQTAGNPSVWVALACLVSANRQDHAATARSLHQISSTQPTSNQPKTAPRPPRVPPEELRDPRGNLQEPQGVPRNQEGGFSQVLLPFKRRAAGDTGAGQDRAGGWRVVGWVWLRGRQMSRITVQIKQPDHRTPEQAVQPHIGKCFDGIRRLQFGEDPKSTDILALVSGES
jgi:hypothetical protein